MKKNFFYLIFMIINDIFCLNFNEKLKLQNENAKSSDILNKFKNNILNKKVILPLGITSLIGFGIYLNKKKIFNENLFFSKINNGFINFKSLLFNEKNLEICFLCIPIGFLIGHLIKNRSVNPIISSVNSVINQSSSQNLLNRTKKLFICNRLNKLVNEIFLYAPLDSSNNYNNPLNCKINDENTYGNFNFFVHNIYYSYFKIELFDNKGFLKNFENLLEIDQYGNINKKESINEEDFNKIILINYFKYLIDDKRIEKENLLKILKEIKNKMVEENDEKLKNYIQILGSIILGYENNTEKDNNLENNNSINYNNTNNINHQDDLIEQLKIEQFKKLELQSAILFLSFKLRGIINFISYNPEKSKINSFSLDLNQEQIKDLVNSLMIDVSLINNQYIPYLLDKYKDDFEKLKKDYDNRIKNNNGIIEEKNNIFDIELDKIILNRYCEFLIEKDYIKQDKLIDSLNKIRITLDNGLNKNQDVYLREKIIKSRKIVDSAIFYIKK